MLPECLMNVCQRKSSVENYKLENAPMVVRRSNTRTPSKPPLKTSTYHNRVMGTDCTRSYKVARPQKGGLVNTQQKAEQKRAQRKARANASPTELSSSDLYCSICNRQFRAKIGLISHLTRVSQ